MLLITQRIIRQRMHDDVAEREGLVMAEHVHDIAEAETDVEEGEHQQAMAPEP